MLSLLLSVPSLLSAPLTAKAAVRASGPSMVMGLTQTPVSQLERDPYRSAEDRAWTRGNPWGQWHNPFDPIHYDAPYSPRGKALDGYQVYEANGRAYGDYSSINGYGGYGGVGGIGGYGGYGGYGYSRMGGGMRVGGGMGYGYGGGGYGGCTRMPQPEQSRVQRRPLQRCRPMLLLLTRPHLRCRPLR